MNNLFGLDIDDFDRSYPGVYGAYKQNCKDPDIPCCTGVCQDICKSSGKCINGWNDSCGSSCEDVVGSNKPIQPTGDNSDVFFDCVGGNSPGRCTGNSQDIVNCYTQGCKNDPTCIDDNGGWFHNFCSAEGDWPGHTDGPSPGPMPQPGPSPGPMPGPMPVPPRPQPRPRPTPGPKPGPTPGPTPTPVTPTPQSGLLSKLSTPEIGGVSIGGVVIVVLIIFIIVKLASKK